MDVVVTEGSVRRVRVPGFSITPYRVTNREFAEFVIVTGGGSQLCTPQYCYRYGPAGRQPQMIDTATSHLGCRPIVRPGT